LLPYNFISDLENAVATRSDKTGTMLRQITDLFLLHAGHYSAAEVGIYDEVLQILVTKVDVAARATLARRLAPIDVAPPNTVRSLALDDAIEVAEPILAHSNALDEATLLHCISTKSQDHLLAIATRARLDEKVSDRLVEKGDVNVLGALANNVGAAISEPGFKMLVERSQGDDWLSESIARRSDIPDHHFRELVSKASEIVRQRLMASNPEHRDIIEKIFGDDSGSTAEDDVSAPRDYRTAELVVSSRPLTEAVVNEFAKSKKLEEIVVSIARLSGLPMTEIERLFLATWSSPVAVILKAIGFHLATIEALYRARLSAGDPIRDDLTRTKAEFIALSRPTAERIVRFYRSRKSVEFTAGRT
jgi:uncharacterized protein (DUF2336 family)